MTETQLRHKRLTDTEKKAATAAKRLKPLGTGMMLPGLVAEQKRLLKRHNDGPSVATTRITNCSTSGDYKGQGPDASDHRSGANDFLKIPSRFNGVLHYRDGRKVAL